MPSDIIQVEKQRLISFYYTCSDDDFNTDPSLMASVVVHEDMTVKAFVDSTFLQRKMYGHLMELDTISRMTEVSNILAFCKNLCDDLQYKSMKNNSCIDLAISALKQYKNDDSSGSCMHFVQFAIEQLNLIQLSKSG